MSKLIVTADAGSTVNLRQSASTSSAVITKIKIGTEVELIEKVTENWCKIKYDKYEGYMMAKYLKSPNQSKISQEDLHTIYNSLQETLTLIEKILK